MLLDDANENGELLQMKLLWTSCRIFGNSSKSGNNLKQVNKTTEWDRNDGSHTCGKKVTHFRP